MYKEVWVEEKTASGLEYMTKHIVRSRKHRSIDKIAVFLDKAVTAVMYAWSVVLAVATAAVIVRIWF